MKKFILSLIFTFMIQPCFAVPAIESPIETQPAPLEASISLDWLNNTQAQRDENIKNIQEKTFKDIVFKYKRKDFKSKYSEFWKIKDYLKVYDEISNGKKEDSEKYYCGFYVGKLLVAYGIQYKNNLKNIYYYDAMGNLRWVDIFSDNYPQFPYWSYQYYRNGDLIAVFYYISSYDQYVFSPDKSFKGRWFKDKLYNKKAKVIMTRTNW